MDRLPTPVFSGFPGGSAGKESTCNAGDLGSIPGLGGSHGEGNGYPLQCSGLENSNDCIVHELTKSWTQLSNFHFVLLHFNEFIIVNHKFFTVIKKKVKKYYSLIPFLYKAIVSMIML